MFTPPSPFASWNFPEGRGPARVLDHPRRRLLVARKCFCLFSKSSLPTRKRRPRRGTVISTPRLGPACSRSSLRRGWARRPQSRGQRGQRGASGRPAAEKPKRKLAHPSSPRFGGPRDLRSGEWSPTSLLIGHPRLGSMGESTSRFDNENCYKRAKFYRPCVARPGGNWP